MVREREILRTEARSSLIFGRLGVLIEGRAFSSSPLRLDEEEGNNLCLPDDGINASPSHPSRVQSPFYSNECAVLVTVASSDEVAGIIFT